MWCLANSTAVFAEFEDGVCFQIGGVASTLAARRACRAASLVLTVRGRMLFSATIWGQTQTDLNYSPYSYFIS